jgi:hypothetical protein
MNDADMAAISQNATARLESQHLQPLRGRLAGPA